MESPEPAQAPKKPVNWFKKADDWTGLLRNIAAIVASFISLITLFILLKQNEQTYRPDLVFKGKQNSFKVQFKENPKSCEDLIYSTLQDSQEINEILVHASNIGLGAAKSIQIQWQYDGEQMDDTIFLKNTAIPTQAQFNKDLDLLVFPNCYIPEKKDQFADYCLPISYEKEPVVFSLPRAYLFAWANILIRTAQYPYGSNETRLACVKEAVATFQGLQANVTFVDINNKQYKQGYRVKLAPGYIDLVDHELIVSWKFEKLNQAVESSQPFEIIFLTKKDTFYTIPAEF